jgi:hypothetical protein
LLSVPRRSLSMSIEHQLAESLIPRERRRQALAHLRYDTPRGGRVPQHGGEKTKGDTLDRARHMLRMGFIVYEIRDPSGAFFPDEPTVRAQFSEGVAT